MPIRYRIVVRGKLMRPETGPLEGLPVGCEGGFSVIICEIIDQSQFHGILDWLSGEGIDIVSLSPFEGSQETGDMGGGAAARATPGGRDHGSGTREQELDS